VWIEIIQIQAVPVTEIVTPHAGVWIEIRREDVNIDEFIGHAPRGRVD